MKGVADDHVGRMSVVIRVMVSLFNFGLMSVRFGLDWSGHWGYVYFQIGPAGVAIGVAWPTGYPLREPLSN